MNYLSIQGFQKHKTLGIDLDQITIIAGDTEKGKSSAVRALYWLALNPAGNDFIRKGCKTAKVVLHVDGHTIIRKRGKSNVYYLDGKKYVSFGSGKVPDPISKVLGLGTDNFQMQLDPPFWFSLSPGQISKELNQIINLEVIDSSLAFIASKQRNTKAELEVVKSRLAQARMSKSNLDWVGAFDLELQRLETQKSWLDSSASSIALQTSALDDVSRVVKRHQNVSGAAVDAAILAKDCEKIIKEEKKLESLSDLIGKTERAEKLAQLEVPSVEKLEEAELDLASMEKKNQWLQQTIASIERREKLVLRNQLRATNLLDSLQGVACPLCGRKNPKSSASSSRTST